MPQKIILLILSSITFFTSQAQVDTMSIRGNHNLIVSLTAGMAVPLGKFSVFELDSSSYTSNITGIPEIGFNVKTDLTYTLSNNFGISCAFFTSTNQCQAVDSASLFYDPCPWCRALGGGSVRLSYSYDTKNWNTNCVLAGMVFRFIRDNRILNFKINGGVQKVQSPESQVNETGFLWQINWMSFPPYNSNYIEPSMTSYNFVFDASVDLQFYLIKKFGLDLSFNYMTSRASFSGQATYSEDVFDGVNNYHYEESRYINFVKNINLFNFNAGLFYAIK